MKQMEHLNYSRQLARECLDVTSDRRSDRRIRSIASNMLRLHKASAKFLLPDGGRPLDDPEYKAMDESLELRLPHPCVCLEYKSNGRERDEGEPICMTNGSAHYERDDFVSAPKRVVYAEEIGGFIVVTVAFWVADGAGWRILPECAIPKTGYLNRSVRLLGRVGINVAFKDQSVPMSDYADEIGSLLCLLNVLQCSNVKTDVSQPKRSGKKVKAAMPFDSYHILTIDATPSSAGAHKSCSHHRSPREHLRRGHVRRLLDGRKIWVNASVVAARGSGVVTKRYAIGRA